MAGMETIWTGHEEAHMLDRFTWYQQSAYLWHGDNKDVYIDPWGLSGDLPDADVIFITHAHEDHFSQEDIDKVRRAETTIVAPRDIADSLSGQVQAVAPGDSIEVAGIKVQCVPAYNIVEERLQAHPKENNWVGYLLELGDTTYYHAGDTDHLPELESVRADVAFVPIGGNYCMAVPEAAGFVKTFSPQLAVPMHYGFFPGVGEEADGERFRQAADPVKVEVLKPMNPFRA
jgi:L-ascorbate metabolism protein UlaG (beta-lactamase superfamily)